MSAIDKIIGQISGATVAAGKKDEYIEKIVKMADKLTDAQVEYVYCLIKQLFCQTAD